MTTLYVLTALLALTVAFRAGRAWQSLDDDLEHISLIGREHRLAAEVWDDCVREIYGRPDAIPNPYRPTAEEATDHE